MTDTQLIPCPSCGASNRVPLAQLTPGRRPVCGRCKTPLPDHAGPLTITDASFAADVEQSPLPVLLDMWAPWCGPCQAVGPIVEQIAQETAGRLRVGKMNVDDNPATSQRFQIRGIPALLIFQQGREVDRIVGSQPKAAILSRLAKFL
jgi:thioredoxin 2